MERTQSPHHGVALMLLFSRNGFLDPALAAAEIERLEELTRDLRRLLAGQKPTAMELHLAPEINSWLNADFGSAALAGRVTTHPLLPGKRAIVTSPIAVSAEDLGWVRTSSRYYRLGQKFGFDKDKH